VLEKLAWVYEQQRDWRAALDIWRELPAEKQRERAVVAAHYCCELGEAALAANDVAAARTQLAQARVHAPGAARVRMLAARVSAAAGEESKALDLYSEALGGSRTIHDAFLQEAREALKARAPDLEARLKPAQSADPAPAPPPARFRCGQCGITSVTWHWRCPGCRSWDSLESVNNRAH
jgi:lipopolysaccharide biosynthesis regulator YciM